MKSIRNTRQRCQANDNSRTAISCRFETFTCAGCLFWMIALIAIITACFESLIFSVCIHSHNTHIIFFFPLLHCGTHVSHLKAYVCRTKMHFYGNGCKPPGPLGLNDQRSVTRSNESPCVVPSTLFHHVTVQPAQMLYSRRALHCWRCLMRERDQRRRPQRREGRR